MPIVLAQALTMSEEEARSRWEVKTSLDKLLRIYSPTYPPPGPAQPRHHSNRPNFRYHLPEPLCTGTHRSYAR